MDKDKSLNVEKTNMYIKLIHKHLSSDLLMGQYKDKPVNAHSTYGLCSVASEALYFMLGGLNSDLVSYVVRDDGSTHWWLQDSNGVILDSTVSNIHLLVNYHPIKEGYWVNLVVLWVCV